MIVEIEKPRPSVESALDYNEGKVLHGVAELVGYANMDGTTREKIYSLLQRYERGAVYPTVERSFHASVNPSAADTCGEAEVLGFISGLMEELGYGNQPYLVYRHFDIEREHYHIVSVRIGKDGRKINNYYEKRRAAAYMQTVSERFDFTVPVKGERVSVRDDIAREGRAPSFRFDRRRGVSSQVKALFLKALTYDFSSFRQLAAVLGDLGIEATLQESGGAPDVTLRGLDKKGNPVTEALSSENLGEPLHDLYLSALQRNRGWHALRRREKERVRSLVGAAFRISRSEGHFVNILHNKGIDVHFSRTEESGDIFGVTFVDHPTRSVFKASEIRDVLSVRMLQEAVSTGKWRPEERGRARSSYVRSSREAAREDAIRLRDLHVGTVARILQPAGQPRGSSWSGRVAPTKEQLREKWDGERAGRLGASFEDRRYEEKIR